MSIRQIFYLFTLFIMNKKQFIKEISEALDTSMSVANDIVDTVFDTITNCLLSWQEVNVPWFGKFCIQKRKAKAWINPRTKEAMQIPAYSTPTFKAWTPLKKAVKAKFK